MWLVIRFENCMKNKNKLLKIPKNSITVSRLGPEAIQCKIYAQGSSFTTARQNVKNLCKRVSEGLN